MGFDARKPDFTVWEQHFCITTCTSTHSQRLYYSLSEEYASWCWYMPNLNILDSISVALRRLDGALHSRTPRRQVLSCRNLFIKGHIQSPPTGLQDKIKQILPPYSFFIHRKIVFRYSKTCVKRPLSKRAKIGCKTQLSLNAGQKYCRMLQWEHSAIFWPSFSYQLILKIFLLSIFEWPLNGLTQILLYIKCANLFLVLKALH